MDETVAKLRPQILRTEADPRPVVVMTCGIAGTKTALQSPANAESHR